MADILIHQENPKKKYWLRYIDRRLKIENKNFFAFISGQTGTGKTYSALWICENADPTFNVDRVVFDAYQLVEMIASPKKYNLKRGSFILFDEVAVSLGSKDHLKAVNKMLVRIFSTIRSRNYGIIVTSPYIDFMDKTVRKLLHAEFKTLSIDRKNKICKVKPLLLEYNDRANNGNGRWYNKYLKVIKEGKAIKLTRLNVPLASEKLIEEYEQKKNDFQSSLYQDSMEELQAINLKEKQRRLRIKTKEEGKVTKLSKREQEVKNFLEEGHSFKDASEHLGVSKARISQIKKHIEEKGYEIGGYYQEQGKA